MTMRNIQMPRKHGLKARAALTGLRRVESGDVREASVPGARRTTRLSFEFNSQAYLWITDRGRSRPIKH